MRPKIPFNQLRPLLLLFANIFMNSNRRLISNYTKLFYSTQKSPRPSMPSNEPPTICKMAFSEEFSLSQIEYLEETIKKAKESKDELVKEVKKKALKGSVNMIDMDQMVEDE